MKRQFLIFILGPLLLVSCAPQLKTNVILPNASLTDAKKLKLECEVAATKEIPSAMATFTSPTYTTPSNTECRVAGVYSDRLDCTTTGGQTLGGELKTIDANLSLRQRVYLQCLENKGFIAYTLPICSQEQVNQLNTRYLNPQTLQNYIQRYPTPKACYLTSHFHGDEFAFNPL